MSEPTVMASFDGGVYSLTLNRPAAKNALTQDMAHDLTRALKSVQQNDRVRVVLLQGAGDSFCAGADVKAMSAGNGRSPEEKLARLQSFQEIVRGLHKLPCPLVVAVTGVAYGAGLSLVTQGDIVITAEDSRFCAVFHRIGLIPDLGLWHSLPRAVGLQRARELIFSAREFSGAEAQKFGLALEALPQRQVQARARQLAESLAQGPQMAATLSRQALQQSLQSDLESILDLEAAAQGPLTNTDYFREALTRLSQRQSPQLNWPVPLKSASETLS